MVKKWKTWISRFYLLIVTLFLYAPILVLIVLSFNDSHSRVVWGGFTLKWYSQLFSNHQVMDALVTTVLVALLSALISTVIGVIGAVGIHAMKKRFYQVTMFATNVPMLNADIVTGIAMMLWFVHFMELGFASVLIAHVTFCIPFVIFSVMPKLQQMNVSFYEAARDLGAGPIYGFFKAILPQLSGGILAGFFMAVTISMDDFVVTYFTRAPGINTLSTMIYGQIRRGIRPETYALSTVIFIVVFIVLLIANFHPKKKRNINAGGSLK